MKADNQQSYSEGDVVSYTTESGQQDAARVRRTYEESLQLVNAERGYQLVPVERITAIVGEIIPGTYDIRPKEARQESLERKSR